MPTTLPKCLAAHAAETEAKKNGLLLESGLSADTLGFRV